jgi:hypothetical protein
MFVSGYPLVDPTSRRRIPLVIRVFRTVNPMGMPSWMNIFT